jgi:iron(III) transport system ATP-binding protein
MHSTSAAPAGQPYLRIDQVKKQFGSFWALKDVSLSVAAGEFVCFLGPSGCGKTTLLRAIAGLDIQSSGRIFQGDREISNLPSSQRDFGIVFQSYALFPNLSVSANVGYGLVSRGMPRVQINTRVDELLKLVGLPESGPKYPAQLSGGQQQRVALARALALSPGLLLLDEPLSALDARVRAYLRAEIRRLHERLGVTTIMVTHDQEEALTMADRIVVMNQGLIEQVGTPEEIYLAPASTFVADFVGTTNFLDSVVVRPGLVRYGDIDLACEFGLQPGPGSDVTLAVRPEDLVVRNVDLGAPNTFTARVDELEFLGAFCRARLVAGGQGKAPMLADFSTNLVRDMKIDAGMMLNVALPAERVRVFPARKQLSA